MKTSLECISCKVRQAIDVVRRATDDEEIQERAIREMLALISEVPFSRPPVAVRRDVEAVVKKILDVEDAYIEHKRISNQIGKKLYPELKKIVADSPTPLRTALNLSVAGNIIDFGMFRMDEVNEERVRELVERSLSQPFAVDDSGLLMEKIEKSDKIWLIADNTGELFFDRVLVEELPADRVTVVVRGAPILNDATLADAEETGLTGIVNVIADGYDSPALMLDYCDPKVRDGFFEADLVISKGQGNYEALSHIEREIFFLLMVKCEVVAQDISANLGDIVIKRCDN